MSMGNEGGRSSLCSKMKCESRVGVGAPRAVRVLIHACRSKQVRRGIQVPTKYPSAHSGSVGLHLIVLGTYT